MQTLDIDLKTDTTNVLTEPVDKLDTVIITQHYKKNAKRAEK